MAANYPDLIPTYFHVAELELTEHSPSDTWTDFKPPLGKTYSEKVAEWLRTRPTTRGLNIVTLANAENPVLTPPIRNEDFLVSPAIRALRQQIAFVSLASGFDRERSFVHTSYCTDLQAGPATEFDWHINLFRDLIPENASRVQAAGFFYSPEEPNTQILELKDPFKAKLAERLKTAVRSQNTGHWVAPDEVQHFEPTAQAQQGNVFGVDMTRQPLTRSPQDNERLLSFKVIGIAPPENKRYIASRVVPDTQESAERTHLRAMGN